MEAGYVSRAEQLLYAVLARQNGADYEPVSYSEIYGLM